MRVLKVVMVLVAAALAGLVGYAYLGDMGADPQPTRVPVQLDLDAATTTAPAPEPAPAPAPPAATAPAETSATPGAADALD